MKEVQCIDWCHLMEFSIFMSIFVVGLVLAVVLLIFILGKAGIK